MGVITNTNRLDRKLIGLRITQNLSYMEDRLLRTETNGEETD